MTRRWTLRVGAGLVVAATLLSGCSEKHEASTALPTSGAAETTPELPPLGPDDFPVPAEAREKTPDGALAFAKYYMSLGTKIGAGKVPAKVLLELSTEDCRLCGQVAASYTEDQTAGYTYLNDTYTFKEYGPPHLEGDSAELGFVFTQSAYTVVDASGQNVADRAGEATGDLQSGMLLEWRKDLHSWLVSSLTVG